MLKDIGVCVDDYNRRRLRNSLELWSHLSIRHAHWYEATRYSLCTTREEFEAEARRRKHVRKLLPPLIRSVETDSRRVRIVVAEAWREIATHYYAQVKLPLPLNAAAQNLVLGLTTSPPLCNSEPGLEIKCKRSVRKLCRKLGLNHATRRRTLEHAIKIAEVWFAERGIQLIEMRRDGLIIFALSEPEAGRVEPRQRRLVIERKPTATLPEAEIDDDGDEEPDGNVYDMDGNRIGG